MKVTSKIRKVKHALGKMFTDAGAAKEGMKKAFKSAKRGGIRPTASDVYSAASKGMKKAKRNRMIAAGGAAGVTAGIGAGMYAKNKSKKKK